MVQQLANPQIEVRHLTSAEIVDLLSVPDIRTGELGRLEAVRRYTVPGYGVDFLADQRFVDELRAQAEEAARGATAGPRIPLDPTRRSMDGSDLHGSGPKGERANKPLTSTDLAWLDRLPEDASKITEAESIKVAKLWADVPEGSTDAMIVGPVLQRIRDWYELQRVDAQLAGHRSQRGYTSPAGAEKLLAEALRREQPDGSDLTERELRRRAGALLERADQTREKARSEREQELTAKMRRLRFGVTA